MTHQHATIEDTVYFWFASNDTSGSGGDGASAAADVREAGAAAGAAPLLSPTPTLLSHANFPAGCYEVAVAATAANGFAAADTFGVFCTLAVDSQNPTGFIGSCTLTPLATEAELAKVPKSDGTSSWNATALAAIEGEVDDALVAQKLDHLVAVAAAEDEVADNSVIARLAATEGDWSEFNDENHSLEAIRVRGDAAWVTGGGTGLTALATGTAQSGTASTIVLAGASTFADGELSGNVINIHTGTGAGQSRVITSNTLADDTCNVTPNWTTNPSSDSQYEIVQGSTNETAVSLTPQTANDNGSDIALIISDTDELQTNQGNWLTLVGAATEAKQDIIDTNVDQIEAAVITNAALADISADIAAVKAETNEIALDTDDLQSNQGAWLTVTGQATEAKQDIIDTNVDAILVDTGTDIPALIAALNDFDPAADTVALVTDITTKTGFSLSTAGIDAIWDRDSTLSITFEVLVERIYQLLNNELNITNADGSAALRNLADSADMASSDITDNGTTTQRAVYVWV